MPIIRQFETLAATLACTIVSLLFLVLLSQEAAADSTNDLIEEHAHLDSVTELIHEQQSPGKRNLLSETTPPVVTVTEFTYNDREFIYRPCTDGWCYCDVANGEEYANVSNTGQNNGFGATARLAQAMGLSFERDYQFNDDAYPHGAYVAYGRNSDSFTYVAWNNGAGGTKCGSSADNLCTASAFTEMRGIFCAKAAPTEAPTTDAPTEAPTSPPTFYLGYDSGEMSPYYVQMHFDVDWDSDPDGSECLMPGTRPMTAAECQAFAESDVPYKFFSFEHGVTSEDPPLLTKYYPTSLFQHEYGEINYSDDATSGCIIADLGARSVRVEHNPNTNHVVADNKKKIQVCITNTGEATIPISHSPTTVREPLSGHSFEMSVWNGQKHECPADYSPVKNSADCFGGYYLQNQASQIFYERGSYKSTNWDRDAGCIMLSGNYLSFDITGFNRVTDSRIQFPFVCISTEPTAPTVPPTFAPTIAPTPTVPLVEEVSEILTNTFATTVLDEMESEFTTYKDDEAHVFSIPADMKTELMTARADTFAAKRAKNQKRKATVSYMFEKLKQKRGSKRAHFKTTAANLGLTDGTISKANVKVFNAGEQVAIQLLDVSEAMYAPLQRPNDFIEANFHAKTIRITNIDGVKHRIECVSGTELCSEDPTVEKIEGAVHRVTKPDQPNVYFEIIIGSVTSDGEVVVPTDSPTAAPTETPTATPTAHPTRAPTTASPTKSPTDAPTGAPTDAPRQPVDFTMTLDVAYADYDAVKSAVVQTINTNLESVGESHRVTVDDVEVQATGRRLLSSLNLKVTLRSDTTASQSVVQSAVNTMASSPATLVANLQAEGVAVTTVGVSSVNAPEATNAPTDAPTDAPTNLPTNAAVADPVAPVAVCGDGVVEALAPSHNGHCPSVSSQRAPEEFTPEQCDVNTAAQFGSFVAGAGCGAAGDCGLKTGHSMQQSEVDSSMEAKDLQLIWGFNTDVMNNFHFHPHLAGSGTASSLNPCLYSTQLIDSSGAVTTTRADAVGCLITESDRTKYTTLANCYNSVKKDHSESPTLSELQEFGKRLTSSDSNFALNGHKCQYPATIEVTSPVGGAMSWAELPRDSQTGKYEATSDGKFPGMYDLCFHIKDPSWPAVHPSSNEFVAQLTRIQYEIVCDPEDQIEAFPDADGNCEEFSDYSTDPATNSFKCTRLGNRANPCSNVDKLWELYSCDDSSCESLEGSSSVTSSQYGTTSDTGVKYTFEHDSAPEKNKFQCTTNQFDNVELMSAGMVFGDSVEAQNRYICGTGGQSTPCDENMGEIVHDINTCSNGFEYQDNLALKDRIPSSQWQNLETLAASVDSSLTPALCDAACELKEGDDYYDATTVAACSEYKKYRDLQQYKVGCGRRLKIRVAKGVSGQLVLRVVAKNYNTAVYDADATRGYTYWTAAMVPVSIEAKVNTLESTHNSGRDASVTTSVDEKSSLLFMNSGVGQSTSPFKNIEMVGYATMQDEASRITQFSRSTRAHIEFIDCTNSTRTFSIERNEHIPRFRISSTGMPTAGFSGGYDYFDTYFAETALDFNRIYEMPSANSYLGPTVAELHQIAPRLSLRSVDDYTTDPTWWASYVDSYYSSLSEIDSWHEGYSTNEGICLKTRLHLYEPSSCDSTSIDSPEYNIKANPINTDVSLSVSSMQMQHAWDEDTTVPLKISVHHSSTNSDSRMWYFSHVEIEDVTAGKTLSAAEQMQHGYGFNLFGYGHTEGATSSISDASDALTTKVGISRTDANRNVWRSFTNKCTKWIYEQGYMSGDSDRQGGFNSDQIDATVYAPFASAEECLDDARRQGEAIWGQPADVVEKTGLYLRPLRKMTKNVELRVTVYMYDGDPTGWHAALPLERTADTTIKLVHVPTVTRYDQREISQSDMQVSENGFSEIQFSSLPKNSDGVGLAMPYRDGTHVCTYTKIGATGADANVDEYDTSVADHDMVCDPDAGEDKATGKMFGSCDNSDASLRVTCELSKADSARAEIETLVLFDESEGAHQTGEVYKDGSLVWDDGRMVMPENVIYQPAGNNPRATDAGQWYRVAPCNSAAGSSVSHVYWCDSSTDSGREVTGSKTDGFSVANGNGQCDLLNKGQVSDPASAAGSELAPLQNSLSVDSNNDIDLSGPNGKSQNFWIVDRVDSKANVPLEALCVHGMSDFNTEDTSFSSQANSPINLRLISVMRDQVTSSETSETWTARSKSNTDQGAFNVNVKTIRQLAVPYTKDHAWQMADTGNGEPTSWIEERNNETRAKFTGLKHTWAEVASIAGGASPLNLVEDVDCGSGNSSDIYCADKLVWTEQSDFHDQHLGRVKIEGYVQKQCGEGASSSWTPAGGLFDVYVQYADDYPGFGDPIPGNGFDVNEGAGFHINDDDAAEIVRQDFTSAQHGTQISGDGIGQSICRIIFDNNHTVGDTIGIRNTPCHIRPRDDVIGHNTYTWSNTILSRVIVNKCHKIGAGTATSLPLDCPPGPLTAREIASNLRFRLPMKWSNCLRFKFDITVGNDDRVLPTYRFSQTVGSELVNFASDTATVFVAPQERAEEPTMWINTDLSTDPECLGDTTTSSCTANARGIQAASMLVPDAYSAIGPSSNLDQNGAMTQLTMIAGYRSQIRVLALSAATDVENEHDKYSDAGKGYEWDSLRSTLKASGETVYLTVESKFKDMDSTKSNQRFCLWMCPSSTPDGSGCAKSDLVRIQGLPDDASQPFGGLADTDYTQTDVNCEPCTGDETSSPPCYERRVDSSGTVHKCADRFGRDTSLEGCPSYSDATPFHNPSSRYSIKCSKAGVCPEMRNLYVQYPPDQINDDILEYTLWSRGDWQANGAGYQKVKLSMNILMKPAIAISEVGFAVEQDDVCDPDQPSVNCPTGSFGVPLQPSHLISITPAANPPIALSVFESVLHGDPSSSGCEMQTAVAKLSSKGSTSDVATKCGLRIPVNFEADNLMLVAPIGVKLEIRATPSFPARILAQSVRMLCSQYALEANAGSPSQCVGEFVSVPGASTDTDLLRFQSQVAVEQPSIVNGRVITGYEPSEHPANELAWIVGEQMLDKEFVLYGLDETPHALVDYSLQNRQCEGSKMMTLDITHKLGYDPNTVASVRSSMTVEVMDDDFYGKVQLAGLKNTDQITPINGPFSPSNHHTMAKSDWNADDSLGTQSDEPFSVYVVRSRMPSESDTPEKRAIGMQALRVWIKVDLGGLNTNEFNISIAKTHGRTDEVITATTIDAATLVQGDGVTPNMIPIDFDAIGPQTSRSDVPTNECKGCDADSDCTYYNCDYTEGSPDEDVPFQFVVISFNANGPASGCNEGGDKNLKFNIEKVVYTSEAGADFVDTEIDCGLDAGRNPLSALEKATVFKQDLTITPSIPHEASPFRVSFAGFDPTTMTGAEGLKASPIAWNAGLDSSYVSITETEHSDCIQDVTSGSYVCQQREFKMHLCTTLRDDVASEYQASPWQTWEASNFRMYTEIVDSTNPWAQIGNLFDLHCPTDAELTAMSNAAPGGVVDCQVMSTMLKVNTADATSEAIVCPNPDAALDAEYCGADVPKRLMWTFGTLKDQGRNAFACPTAETANNIDENGESVWKNLPFARFVMRDDNNEVNLSRKPNLCISNGKLPMAEQSGANTDTCSSLSDLTCIPLRIRDDEIFAQDNSFLDRDVALLETEFMAPTWDSVEGRLEIDVKNRYFTDATEKTLVNVAVGGCEPEIDHGASNPYTLKEFWNRHAHSTSANPVQGDTASESGDYSAFGNCDLLNEENFDGLFGRTLGNKEMFEKLFGDDSLQLNPTQYDNTDAYNLFGFTAADIGAVSGQNTLFTSARDLGPGASWNILRSAIESRGNVDLDDRGFVAQLSLSLEKLKSCTDRLGHPAVVTSVDSEGNTNYRFKLSSTHVTATRRGDTSYVEYSPMCSEREYTLSVSNNIYALSGMSTPNTQDLIYVDTVGYSPADTCTTMTDCDSSIGPKHTCPTQIADFQALYLNSMSYSVNLDMRTVSNIIGGSTVQNYYGVAAMSDIVVNSDNCYGSFVESVDTLSADGSYTESGISRTRVNFRTGCAYLRPFENGAYSNPVADTFAMCKDDAAKATDFSFKTRVWECSEEAHLADPVSSPTCQMLPDYLDVSIAIAFIESPTSVEYEIDFEKSMKYYLNNDHRNMVAARQAAGVTLTYQHFEDWRHYSKLETSADRPNVMFPINSMLTASLGFVAGSPLEEVMTTSIDKVRLCRLKEFCFLNGVADAVAGAPQCSWTNIFYDRTHSPYARWARNVNGCAELSTSGGCATSGAQSTVAVPALTCEKVTWENYVIAEGVEYMSNTAKRANLISALNSAGSGSTPNALSVGSIAMMLDPTIEDTLMVNHGTTTPIAESIYGNCEKNAEVVGVPEAVLRKDGQASNIQLSHIFPQASLDQPAGACTCKGQRAYSFTDSNGNSAYRNSANRKVVYSTSQYSNDVNNPANLQKCTWLNAPTHSITGEPLNSVDQFSMSLANLQRGQDYFFELTAVQYDHDAFSSEDISSAESQYSSNRRMLSHKAAHGHLPTVKRAQVSHSEKQSSNNRKMLQLLLPVDTTPRTQIMMPQGSVSSDDDGYLPPAPPVTEDADISNGNMGIDLVTTEVYIRTMAEDLQKAVANGTPLSHNLQVFENFVKQTTGHDASKLALDDLLRSATSMVQTNAKLDPVGADLVQRIQQDITLLDAVHTNSVTNTTNDDESDDDDYEIVMLLFIPYYQFAHTDNMDVWHVLSYIVCLIWLPLTAMAVLVNLAFREAGVQAAEKSNAHKFFHISARILLWGGCSPLNCNATASCIFAWVYLFTMFSGALALLGLHILGQLVLLLVGMIAKNESLSEANLLCNLLHQECPSVKAGQSRVPSVETIKATQASSMATAATDAEHKPLVFNV